MSHDRHRWIHMGSGGSWLVLSAVMLTGCEPNYTINITSPTSPSLAEININNTNTNTNTNNDKTGSDIEPSNNGAPQTGVIPLPAYGESVTRKVAAENPTALAHSCQDKFGESAWQFLDKVIATLKANSGDSRWGYLCKDVNCTKTARDIVAYRASSGNTGIWIVDVIGNHCPAPGDVVEVRWGVLPFETVRPWSATHQ